jgi:hypothetical protein
MGLDQYLYASKSLSDGDWRTDEEKPYQKLAFHSSALTFKLATGVRKTLFTNGLWITVKTV